MRFAEYSHPGWVVGEHHAQICAALERVERGACRRLMIFAPPRHGKSELASRRFPAWYIGRNPGLDIIATSYNADLATDFGREVRGIVRSEEYRAVFPGITLAVDSAAAGRWHTNHGGQYVSVGVGGTLTGRGGNVIVIDDPIKNREEADSERIRDAIWKWYTSTLRTRLMPGGSIVLMLTRWSEDDLAARALAAEPWDVVSLPAIINEGGDERALWPAWFPLAELQATRAMLRKSGRGRDWDALYQQRPTSESGTYLQRAWFEQRYTERPKELRIYMASDFAVTSEREGRDPDYTEHGVFGIDEHNRLHVIDWWSGRTPADEWIEALLDLVAKHRPIAWFGEAGPIRRAIEPFLTRRARERRIFVRREWVASVADKAARGRSLQAMAASGAVVFPANSEWAGRIIEQCVGFPGSKHDDAFDALSLMCLAIDQAHPAVGEAPAKAPAKRDYGAGERTEGVDWRTV